MTRLLLNQPLDHTDRQHGIEPHAQSPALPPPHASMYGPFSASNQLTFDIGGAICYCRDTNPSWRLLRPTRAVEEGCLQNSFTAEAYPDSDVEIRCVAIYTTQRDRSPTKTREQSENDPSTIGRQSESDSRTTPQSTPATTIFPNPTVAEARERLSKCKNIVISRNFTNSCNFAT